MHAPNYSNSLRRPRREFLKNVTSVTMAVAAANLLRSPVYGQNQAPAPGRVLGANERIKIAVIGASGRGMTHISSFLEIENVRVSCVCEVDSGRLADALRTLEGKQPGQSVKGVTDFRHVLDDPTIDALVIATPNHWHALMTVWACQAGKDVYVEKPISHNVWEGRKAVEADVKYKRIVQAGTQSRSDEALQEAAAYLRAGNLGEIKWARGLCYNLRESIGKSSGPQRVPPAIDYDLWSGPAPLVPPRRNTAKWGTVHYDWHWFWNYGGGDLVNQGIHQLDVARWMLGEAGLPRVVMSLGGRFGYEDDAETPNTQIAWFDYAKAPLIFEVRGLPSKAGTRAMDAYRGIRVGVVVQCENGYFAPGVSGGGGVYDNQGKKITQFSSAGGGKHQANFVAAMRSRKSADLNAPLEGGHISSALCHVANISYRLGNETTNESIREAVRAQALQHDAVSRMMDHLEANQVNTKAKRSIAGPALELVPAHEAFETREKFDTGYWGNSMLGRDYREPFVVRSSV